MCRNFVKLRSYSSVFQIPGSTSTEVPTKSRIDWLSLRYYLESSTFKCRKIHSDIDADVEELTQEITAKVQLATSNTPVTQCKPKVSPGIRSLIRKKNALRRHIQKKQAHASYQSQALRLHLNKLQPELDVALQTDRDKSFKKYIAETESTLKRCWKVIKSLHNRLLYCPPLIKDGVFFSAEEDKVNIFAESLRE